MQTLRRLAPLLLLPLLAAPAQAAESRPVRCTIEVDGAVRESGVCELAPLGGDGGIQLSGAGHFVQLDPSGPDRAQGWWNEDPRATHAQAPLGELIRADGCWTSDRARICVEELPAAEAAARLAARPTGAYLTPDLPGASQSCLRADPAPAPGAALVLDACRSPLAKLFARDGDGRLRVATDPPLCLDLAEDGDPARPAVVLARCASTSPVWRSEASAIASAPVSAAEGWRLAIPAAEDPEARFPFPVVAARRVGDPLPPTRFFLSDD